MRRSIVHVDDFGFGFGGVEVLAGSAARRLGPGIQAAPGR
jgi:hypothetical protein